MLKKIQIKVILSFMIIGIVVITALSLTYIYNLQSITNELLVKDIIETEIKNIKIITGCYIGTFIVLMVVTGIILSKFITSPITSLIKSAEKATKRICASCIELVFQEVMEK